MGGGDGQQDIASSKDLRTCRMHICDTSNTLHSTILGRGLHKSGARLHQVRLQEKMVSSADVQRLFLQAVFSRGILSENLAQALWRKCIDAVKGSNFHAGRHSSP